MIDTTITTSISWERNSEVLIIDSRINATQAQMDTYIYESLLEFSTLSSTLDTGDYSCVATAVPVDQEFAISSVGTAVHYLSVTGECTQCFR